ncbi:MAG TPA: sodium/solute symporter [Spirochaetota bacterium]|nr:sodium/solute symporter [Spirochaetota bacterium]HOM09791.1 sodium/solute symporter [Spirochaetota bacterium]HPP49627.1 sodium/solute symporter [Spirochaetota bacterium]HXK65907.1 sodium/solute symporter [Spirochaetota bacterium]
MSAIDWIIVVLYSICVIGIGYVIGKKQKNQADYYIASQKASAWLTGLSLAANQVSAISLIGVPAFIAIKHNGGLTWLQYELALPLSMMFLILFVVPAFRSFQGFSIYEWLEKRFGKHTRVILALVFLLSRSLATGVAIVATSYVVSVLIGIDLYISIISISLISLLYTSIGGILADIYTDVMQLVVLLFSTVLFCGIIIYAIDGHTSFTIAYHRIKIFNYASFGIQDGNTFSLAPMLCGGFFLYISYYGFDQSQAQRFLSCENTDAAQKAIIINTIVRFVIVMLYSFLGILLLLLLSVDNTLRSLLTNQQPDMLIPTFIKHYIPAGLKGVVISGILAASMSSMDSAINSLSAITYNDALKIAYEKVESIHDKTKLLLSRLLTVFWGVITTLFAIIFAGSSETVVELVNKIGSLLYGPICAVFIIGMLTRKKIHQLAVTGGFATGILVNIYIWLFLPSVSWMWWNATGFFAAVLLPFIFSFFTDSEYISDSGYTGKTLPKNTWFKAIVLGIWFMAIIGFFMIIEKVFE